MVNIEAPYGDQWNTIEKFGKINMDYINENMPSKARVEKISRSTSE